MVALRSLGERAMEEERQPRGLLLRVLLTRRTRRRRSHRRRRHSRRGFYRSLEQSG